MPDYQYSESGFELTKRFEGLRLRAYQDQGGVWTIGYGHTGPTVGPGQEISSEEAEVLLRSDLKSAIRQVNRSVIVVIQQNHFDALVDFCFNAGCGSFTRSTLLRYVNSRNFSGAAEQFSLWIFIKGRSSQGLARRRAAEQAMFLGNYTAEYNA